MADECQSTRAPYTNAEDVFILNYICKSRKYSQVKGTSLWKSLSTRMAINRYNRTWHSLKERFKKHIIPNIADYNLPSEDVKNLVRPYGEQPLERKYKKEKGSRKEYSLGDDEILAKWVLKQKGDVKGNTFWKILEEKNVLPGRTWESMRNRFLRTSLKNLPLLFDDKKCQEVRRRINGDLDFVEYPIERGKYRPVATKLKTEAHHWGRRRRPSSPSPGPVPSTSKGRSVRERRRRAGAGRASSPESSESASAGGGSSRDSSVSGDSARGRARGHASSPREEASVGRRRARKHTRPASSASSSSSCSSTRIAHGRSSSCSSIFLRSSSASPRRVDDTARSRSSSSSPFPQNARRRQQRNALALGRSQSASPELSQGTNALPKKAGKRKLFTMASDLAAEVTVPDPSPVAAKKPPAREPHPPASGCSFAKVPVVLLERCDGKIAEKSATTAAREPPPRNSPESSIGSVTTMIVPKYRDCCCDELVADEEEGPSEVVPCGCECRRLDRSENPSPRRLATEEAEEEGSAPGTIRRRSEISEEGSDRSAERSVQRPSDEDSVNSREKRLPPSKSAPCTPAARHNGNSGENTSGGRQLPGWLRERRRSLSNTPDMFDSSSESEESVPIKTESPADDIMCSINREVQALETSDEDEKYSIDPLYADFIDKPAPCIVMDGVEYSLGSLPFPVVQPHPLHPFELPK